MKKIYTVGFVLMVLLLMTMSAAALESKTISRQNGVAAIASWSDETPDGITYTDLQADKTNDGNDVFVTIFTPTTIKFGSILTQEDVFNIDNKLTTATLSPVQMSLSVINSSTGEFIGEETITIQAQWIGVGDLTKSSSKFMSKSGDFMAKFSDSSIIREASATGSINGQELGTSNFAELIKFKFASMTIEK